MIFSDSVKITLASVCCTKESTSSMTCLVSDEEAQLKNLWASEKITILTFSERCGAISLRTISIWMISRCSLLGNSLKSVSPDISGVHISAAKDMYFLYKDNITLLAFLTMPKLLKASNAFSTDTWADLRTYIIKKSYISWQKRIITFK